MACYPFCIAILILGINVVVTRGDINYKNEVTLKEVLSKMEIMQQMISGLTVSERKLNQSVSILIGDTTQCQSQIAKLMKTIEELKLSNEENKQNIAALEKTMETLIESNGHHLRISTETVNQEGEANSSKSIIREKRHQPVSVSFAAYLDHVKEQVGYNQPIVYNKVLQNEAGAYSVNTGIFRVPVSGVYLLSWSITARRLSGKETHEIWVKLMVNGVRKFDAAAESQFARDDNQGSSTIVIRLNERDEVWVALHVGSGVFGDNNERTTSFTGVLLY